MGRLAAVFLKWLFRAGPPALIAVIVWFSPAAWRSFWLTVFYVAMAVLWASIEWADGGDKPRGVSRIYFAAMIGVAAILAAWPASVRLIR